MDHKEWLKYEISDFEVRLNMFALDKIEKISINKGDVSQTTQMCFHLSKLQSSSKEVKIDIFKIKCLKNKFVGFDSWISRCSAGTFEPGYFACTELRFPELKSVTGKKDIFRLTFEEFVKKFEEKIKTEINELILSLRIVNNSEIWINDIIFNVSIKNKWYNLYMFPRVRKGGSLYGTDTYKLKKNNLTTFKESFKYIKSNSDLLNINPLKVSLAFFDASYQDIPLYGKFINLIIVLESLWLYGSDRGEQTHRICLRISEIFGDRNSASKLKIYNKVNDLFKLRGKIVHGSFIPTNVQGKDISRENMAILRFLARESILRYIILLKANFKNKEIAKFLDEAILDKRKEDSLYKILRKNKLTWTDYK
jgi:hypothetical protein